MNVEKTLNPLGKGWEMSQNTCLGIIPLQVQRASGLFLCHSLSAGAEMSLTHMCPREGSDF